MTSPGPGPAITSAANPRLRAVAALRDRSERARTGHLLVDGAREVGRAIDAAAVIEAFLVEPLPPDPELAVTAGLLAAAGIHITTVSPEAMARIAYGDRSSGIVAVVAAPDASLAGLGAKLDRLGGAALVGVVEDVEKPGNLGAVCRSADGAGLDGLVAAAGLAPSADPWNPNAVRASLGTIFSLPVATASTSEVRDFLRSRGMQVVAARVDGALAYTAVDLTRPSAIVLGSESSGLTDGWRGPDVIGVRIPMRGRADSLNVAATAAILFYEARRQRDARPG